MLIFFTMLSACALPGGTLPINLIPQTDKEKLVAAELVFTTVVDIITQQYKLGNISNEQLKAAKIIANSGNEILNGVQEAIKINDSQLVFVLLIELNTIIKQLQLIVAKKETANHEYDLRYLTDTRIVY